MIGKMPGLAEIVAARPPCSRRTAGAPCRRRLENVDGIRAVCSASISPLASIAASVCVGPIGLIADVRRQVELELLAAARLLLAAGAVGDAVDGHAVVLGEDAADPHRRRHLVLGRPDALADQVLRLADAGVRVDVDATNGERTATERSGSRRTGAARGTSTPCTTTATSRRRRTRGAAASGRTSPRRAGRDT